MKRELKQIDSSTLGISKRTQVAVGKDCNYYIIKNIKSRIIMKDGIRVLEMVKKINKIDPKKNISVRTSAPICSKTKKLLLENNITTKPL